MKRIHGAFSVWTLCGRYLAISKRYEYVYPKGYKHIDCKTCLKILEKRK